MFHIAWKRTISRTIAPKSNDIAPGNVLSPSRVRIRRNSNTHERSYAQYSQSSKIRSIWNTSPGPLGIVATAGAIGTALGAYLLRNAAAEEAEELDQEDLDIIARVGKIRPDLPYFTQEEIRNHGRDSERIWVQYGDGVYDITDFVAVHPGQEKVLLAAGASLEPFWALYGQHKTPQVYRMLEELRIGNVVKDTSSSAASAADISQDPYANEPTRHPALVVRSQKPFNAETPTSLLAENIITPNDLFYVRNHLPVPVVDPVAYRLRITSETEPDKVVEFTLDDLKNKFEQHSVTGNRRNEMGRYKEVKGGSWEIGAISTATWTGPRLRDVIEKAGIDLGNVKDIQHIQFEALDRDFEKAYGASIPIWKGLNPENDVILALKMNGEDLPRDHGYPVRVIVPGVVGARNVKWLHQIKLSKEESPSHWQRNDYKVFGPNIGWDNAAGVDAPAIQDMPVFSCITEPAPGAKIPKTEETITIKGYAWSGGGRNVIRVDVSADGGKTWQQATLQGIPKDSYRSWAWTLWSVQIPVSNVNQGELNICCKAVDSAYNTQPERIEPIWNMRGFLNNSWHRVEVTLD